MGAIRSTTSKLRWAVYNCPTLIPSILNNTHLDKRLSQHILHDLLPRRTSIEIECFGSLATALGVDTDYKNGYSPHSHIPHRTYPSIIRKYNITDFAIDVKGSFDIDYDEHKISILNYTQLIGLFNILNDMAKHCALNISSGSHIHLDLTKCMLIPGFSLDRLEKYMTVQCINGTIERIFGPAPKGHRAVNKCERDSKGHWLNINTQYGSLEFRCAPMTFDYSTIVKCFIQVNKILNSFEHILFMRAQRLKDKTRLNSKKESLNAYRAC